MVCCPVSYLAAQQHNQWQDESATHSPYPLPYSPLEQTDGTYAAEHAVPVSVAPRMMMRAELTVEPVIASQTVQPRARTKATVLAAQRARREYFESRAAETLPTPGVTAFSSPEKCTAVPPAQHADASYTALATVPDRLETPLLDTEITPEYRSTADADLTDLQAVLKPALQLPSKVDLTSGTSDSSVDALPIIVADPAELLPEGADEPVHISITDRQAALLGLAVTVYKADSCTTILAQKLGELLMPLSVPADSKPEASESPLAECDTECPPLPDAVSTDDSLGYAAEQPPKPPDPPEPTSPCVESVSMGTAVRQLTAENTIAMQNNLPDLLPAATNAAALLADAAVAHLPCMPACAAEQTSTNVVPVTAKPMATPSYIQPDTDRFFVRPEPILVSSILYVATLVAFYAVLLTSTKHMVIQALSVMPFSPILGGKQHHVWDPGGLYSQDMQQCYCCDESTDCSTCLHIMQPTDGHST